MSPLRSDNARFRARLRACAALAALACAVLAAPAKAGKTQESIFQADGQLLEGTHEERAQALDDIRALGADTVHVLVQWSRIAPDPLSSQRPKSFDAADSEAYPAGAWERLDDLVREARARDLGVLLTPTSQVPRWAEDCARVEIGKRDVCRPNAAEFGRFVTAMAKRYSGSHLPAGGLVALPRVSRWSIWNEANQGGWLGPQYESRLGRTVPVAPVLYRALAYAGIDALRANGHAGDQIMIGELAPIGTTTGPLRSRKAPPGEFLRAVFCLDERGRRLRGAAARSLKCQNLRRFKVTAFSHHPYTKGGGKPPLSVYGADEITIAAMDRLFAILDGAARRRLIPARLPVLFTEFGYQSNPPDYFIGVPLAKQAEYNNQVEWLSWNMRRVLAFAQYGLRDDTDIAGFQTGLEFKDGRPKPALAAYRLPLWVVARRSGIAAWGAIRPFAAGTAEQVELQSAPRVSGPWTTATVVRPSNPRGYFVVRGRTSGRYWRLRWTPAAGGDPYLSRTATAAPG